MATTQSQHAQAAVGHDVVAHEVGTMDIAEHQRTFVGFVRFMTWTATLSILVLIFLALTNA